VYCQISKALGEEATMFGDCNCQHGGGCRKWSSRFSRLLGLSLCRFSSTEPIQEGARSVQCTSRERQRPFQSTGLVSYLGSANARLTLFHGLIRRRSVAASQIPLRTGSSEAVAGGSYLPRVRVSGAWNLPAIPGPSARWRDASFPVTAADLSSHGRTHRSAPARVGTGAINPRGAITEE
jgi:hypothetical protein